jgi:hypothetical protein
MLVAGITWIIVIVWEMTLYVSGQAVSVFMDNFFRKCRLLFTTQDVFSAIFWGGLGFIWIIIMSQLGVQWWTIRNSTVDDVDEADAMWWAYISILSVYV